MTCRSAAGFKDERKLGEHEQPKDLETVLLISGSRGVLDDHYKSIIKLIALLCYAMLC
jgi:hypothetical protein